MKVFKENNLVLNESEYIWKTQKFKFLGHVLSQNGFTAVPDKIKVIADFRAPNSGYLYWKIYTRSGRYYRTTEDSIEDRY